MRFMVMCIIVLRERRVGVHTYACACVRLCVCMRPFSSGCLGQGSGERAFVECLKKARNFRILGSHGQGIMLPSLWLKAGLLPCFQKVANQPDYLLGHEVISQNSSSHRVPERGQAGTEPRRTGGAQ